MRIVFFGIYEIGVHALTELCRRLGCVVAVVTKPDSPTEPQIVARAAAGWGLPVLQPESPRQPLFLQQLREYQPDLIVVAGYHKVIPSSILDIPPFGTINLHGSLLPKYRGPSTWKWAIIHEEPFTGVTVHFMTPELDAGDILAQRPIAIDEADTGGTLFRRICQAGAPLLCDTVKALEDGRITRQTQDESAATYFADLTDEKTRICWSDGAHRIRSLVRALNPRPGAWTGPQDHRLRIWAVEATDASRDVRPGQVAVCNTEVLRVATSTQDLLIREVGDDRMPPAPWHEWSGRFDFHNGDCLG